MAGHIWYNMGITVYGEVFSVKRIISLIMTLVLTVSPMLIFPAAAVAEKEPILIDIAFDKTKVMWGDSVTATWTVRNADQPIQEFYGWWDVCVDREAEDEDGYITVWEGFDEEYSHTFDVDFGYSGFLYIEFIDADGDMGSGYAEIDFVNPEAVHVEKIELQYDEITVGVGQDVDYLKPKIYPADAADKSLVWYSSDYSVIYPEEGVLWAMGTGTAVVTIKAGDNGGAYTELLVNVIGEGQGVKKITLNKKKATLRQGESMKLKATLTPGKAANKNIVWKSSNPSVATVNEKGKVKAVGKGEATITAYASSGKKAACKITVKSAKVKKITIEGKKNMVKGETQQLVAVVKPEYAKNTNVKWTSSNKKIATVDKNGVVTALKKGKVKITAAAKDGSGVKCVFTIKIKKK